MQTFSCKIELSIVAGSASTVDLDVDGDMRTAIEWLTLGAQRDSMQKYASRCVAFEHTPGELFIRIDKRAAEEVAIARRIS